MKYTAEDVRRYSCSWSIISEREKRRKIKGTWYGVSPERAKEQIEIARRNGAKVDDDAQVLAFWPVGEGAPEVYAIADALDFVFSNGIELVDVDDREKAIEEIAEDTSEEDEE